MVWKSIIMARERRHRNCARREASEDSPCSSTSKQAGALVPRRPRKSCGRRDAPLSRPCRTPAVTLTPPAIEKVFREPQNIGSIDPEIGSEPGHAS
jgi:hypothetical protein